ncbi:glycosyltransferase family 4 protein [Candidatus Pelagibacter communis]|uniref:glycosyltransferase family 4 protein n=1 Tax=Pelagibacter ubique TaxID=198252 RepID=UPI000A7284A4|nr:glycosyltransferase family 4 protein [Candidatus Pelagibacter ubique]
MKNSYIISNPGKFHHFEVARELHKMEMLNKIICGYPWFKLKNSGVPKEKIVSVSLNTILSRFLNGGWLKDNLNISQFKKIDNITKKYFNNNNIYLGLSGSSLNSGIEAKKRNIFYICERSSTHIYHQNNILMDEYKKLKINYKPINKWFIERELREYDEADLILVPSNFVKNTFLEKGIKKIEVLNFGVDTTKFYPINIKSEDDYFNIIFVGQLSVRKGLHYLFEILKKLGNKKIKLHIVGTETSDTKFLKKLIDSDFQDNVVFYGHQNHEKLNILFNKASLFVLPSIEEGMAIVTLQSIASGCPVVVTENTGSKEFIEKYNCGKVISRDKISSLADVILELMEDKNKLKDLKENTKKATNYNWAEYVKTLNLILNKYIKT